MRNTLASDQGKLAYWRGRSGAARSWLSYWTISSTGSDTDVNDKDFVPKLVRSPTVTSVSTEIETLLC